MNKNDKGFKLKSRSPAPTYLFEHGKIPPQALDLEEAVLGGIMLEDSTERIHNLVSKLRPEMFYKEQHQLICKAIKNLHEKESGVDIMLVTEELRFMGELEVVGGPWFITQITNRIGSTSNMDFHFRIIYQKFIQREMIRICSDNIKENYEDTTDCFTTLESIKIELDKLDPRLSETASISAESLATEMIKEFEAIKVDKGGIIIPSMTYSLGWPRFDEVVTIGRDKIIIMAGAAGAGKSKFIHQIIMRLLELYSDISVKWVTLEDSRQDLLRSYIASKVFITPKDIKSRNFDKKYIAQMLHYTERFKSFDVEFIDTAIRSVDITYEFAHFCEHRKDRFNILVVDNILSLDDQTDFKFDPNGFSNFVLHNMLKCRQKTKGLLFLLHHFNDAQQDKENLKTGYRPTVKDMKGSETFRRTANQVLLINSFAIYKDLMAQYQGIDKEILDRLFIMDTGKNREFKLGDAGGLLHFIQDLGFSRFQEIPIPIMQTPNISQTPFKIINDIPF